MDEESISAQEAARRLGIAVTSFYDWLGQSDHGILVIRGQPFTIDYWQGGPAGQGRIRIAPAEVERIKEAMRVHPQRLLPRQASVRRESFPGIVVPLGRPRS